MGLHLDLAGIGVAVEGLDAPLEDDLRALWSGYLGATAAPPVLSVSVSDGASALTPGRTMRGPTVATQDGGLVRLARDEGEAILDPSTGRATVRLATGDSGRRLWGLVNLVTASLGVLLVPRGGAIVHAAGIVLDGRAFLLVGAEGAGKTTFAGAASRAGVPVLSDDQVLVTTRAGALEAIGAPIRNRVFPGPGPGRWPVAAILLPRHGPVAALSPASRLEAAARLSANVLYAPTHDPALVDSILAGAPARWLTFAPEPSFLDVLRTAR